MLIILSVGIEEYYNRKSLKFSKQREAEAPVRSFKYREILEKLA
jgi:hypothetical protein